MFVDVDKIVVLENKRKDFSGVDRLKENMRQYGQLEPILTMVKPASECGKTDQRFLIGGECRLRAAKELGWKKIQCHDLPWEPDSGKRSALGIFENIKRNQFTPSEEAAALAFLENQCIESGEVTTKHDTGRGKQKNPEEKNFAESAALETGMARSTVARKTKIGKRLTPRLAKAMDEKKITEKQAEQIVNIADAKQRDAALEVVEGKSFDETKAVVAKICGKEEKINRSLNVKVNGETNVPMSEKAHNAQVFAVVTSLESLAQRLLEMELDDTCDKVQVHELLDGIVQKLQQALNKLCPQTQSEPAGG